MGIHWFPGHMAQTRRLIVDSLKEVDGVVHLADARLPQSSQNPLIYDLAANKLTMLVLAKADLADPQYTEQWLAEEKALAISLRENTARAVLLEFLHSSLDRALHKRFVRPWRLLIAGIPNVGKSTLINLLAGRRAAKVGDKPGITRTRQWIKISPGMEMMDTPGILWPRIEDKTISYRLAVAGCIRDEILPTVDVAEWLLKYLEKQYPDYLSQYNPSGGLTGVAERMGTITKGGQLDLDKAASLLLRDFRAGRLGRISLEGK